MTQRFFLILANERTGSTALMRLLSGHPEVRGATQDSRVFTDRFSWDGFIPSESLAKRNDLDALYRMLDRAALLAYIEFMSEHGKPAARTPPRVRGAKCSFYRAALPTLRNMARILQTTGEQVKVIHLLRDYDASFISWLVDKRTGRGSDHTADERAETLRTKVRFTREERQRYVDGARERDAVISSLQATCPYLPLDYDTFFSDVENQSRLLFRFLEIADDDEVVKSARAYLDRQPKRLTMPASHYVTRD